MFQYAFGKAAAQKLGARLLIDKSMFDLPYIPEKYRLNAFDLELEFTSRGRNFVTRVLLSPKVPPGARRLMRKVLTTDVLHEAQAAAELGRMSTQPLSRRRMVLVGYFQTPSAFEHLADDLRRDFFIPVKSQGAKDTLDDIEASEAVALHVRRGDYVNVAEFREKLGVLDVGYYVPAMAFIRERVAKPKFFVFTNDPGWAEKKLSAISDDVVVVGPGKSGSDLEDMALMRACTHFIVSNSTFSWWPAFLANRPGKIVVSPNPWFIEDDLGYEARALANWIAVPSNLHVNGRSTQKKPV